MSPSQALRHSKVKLTWDEDEPERALVTKRVLSRKEIEENDFRAYIASSSESESDDDTCRARLSLRPLRAERISRRRATTPPAHVFSHAMLISALDAPGSPPEAS